MPSSTVVSQSLTVSDASSPAMRLSNIPARKAGFKINLQSTSVHHSLYVKNTPNPVEVQGKKGFIGKKYDKVNK